MKLTNRDRKELGAKLRELREKHELTQAHLAHALGYSCNQYISNVERGKAEPTLKMLTYAVKVYGLRAGFFNYLGKLYSNSLKEQINGTD